VSELRFRRERFGPLTLPSGARIGGIHQAFTLRGEPRADGSNVVLAFHSLTGTPDPVTWWPKMVGPGLSLDPAEVAILTPVLAGSCFGTRVLGGTEVESEPEAPSPGGIPDPEDPGPIPDGLDTRDHAYLVGLLLDRLGIARVRLALGGSLGGMVALEWAASFPERTDTVVSFAAPAAQPAQALAFNQIQREAIRLGGFPAGLALARKVAMITYRTAEEFEERFGRNHTSDGRFQMESYLDHHGEKLAARFTAASYLALMGAMDRHDAGAGRTGGARGALERFRGRLVGVGVPGDLLYPDRLVQEWVGQAGALYRRIDSVRGHDAFLLEQDQVEGILDEALGMAEAAVPGSLRAPASGGVR
jgi:homoserine O-acetyltransferase/O-succinyltransferase